MNSTVQNGGFFEVSAEQFTPNITTDGFRSVNCGYKDITDNIPLTFWDIVGGVRGRIRRKASGTQYEDRVEVRDLAIVKIINVNFADEGREFFCELAYINATTSDLDSIVKYVKLDTVYGKENIFLAN